MAAAGAPGERADASAVRMNAASELVATMRVSRQWYSRRAMFLAPLALGLCIATPLVYSSRRPRDAYLCPQQSELSLFALLFTLRVLLVCCGDGILAVFAVNGDVAAQSCAIRTLLRVRASWAPSWMSLGVFLMGNIYVAQSSLSCSDTPMYRYALALLVLEYMQLLLPLLCMCALLAAVCMCMPLVMRLLVATGAIPTTQHPATTDEIARLPEHRYSRPEGATVEAEVCSICLEAYVDGDAVRTLPCGHEHVFHKVCVDNWLKINANCPVCRGAVLRRDASSNPPAPEAAAAAAPPPAQVDGNTARAPHMEEQALLLQGGHTVAAQQQQQLLSQHEP